MADVSYEIGSESTNTNTVDVLGLDNIKTNNTVKADLSLALVQPFKAETASALEVKPLETASQLEIKPLQLEIKPLEADLDLDTKSNLTLDLKPAVIDLCLTANIGKVPNVCVNMPYRHHIGFTWFGTEIWGYSFSGQQDFVVEDIERKPKVVWGEPASTAPHSHQARKPPKPASRQAGGLRVRLGN